MILAVVMIIRQGWLKILSSQKNNYVPNYSYHFLKWKKVLVYFLTLNNGSVFEVKLQILNSM